MGYPTKIILKFETVVPEISVLNQTNPRLINNSTTR